MFDGPVQRHAESYGLGAAQGLNTPPTSRTIAIAQNEMTELLQNLVQTEMELEKQLFPILRRGEDAPERGNAEVRKDPTSVLEVIDHQLMVAHHILKRLRHIQRAIEL